MNLLTLLTGGITAPAGNPDDKIFISLTFIAIVIAVILIFCYIVYKANKNNEKYYDNNDQMQNYCNKCGAKLKENSNFCSNCGVELIKLHNSNITDNKPETPTKEKKETPLWITITIICVVLVAVGLLSFLVIDAITKNNSGNNEQPGEETGSQIEDSDNSTIVDNYRNANNADVLVEPYENYPMEIIYYITPYKDIEGLEITIDEYDEQGNFTRREKYTLGNVKQGKSYPISLSLSGYTTADINNIGNIYIMVTAGRVSKITVVPVA